MGEKVLHDERRIARRRAWLTLLAVVAVTVLLSAAATLLHLRSDWTENRAYTLSDSTTRLLGALKEPVLIRAYITSGLPQPYGQLKQFIEDMLRSYHDAGGGNVGFEMIDPSEDSNVSASLTAMKIPKVQVQVVEDDQAQVRQGYLAVVIEYLDSKETIPVVQSEEGFEYLLTRKIKKLTGKGRVRVGVSSAFGATPLGQMRKLIELAGDDYELVDVDPDKQPLPQDMKALIVAGMMVPPSELFRYRVDQFRMHGGGLLLLAGNVRPALQTGFDVQPVDTYANDWLRSDLGVVVEPGLVMDRRASRVTVNRQQGGFMFRSVADYPFIPAVTDLAPNHPVTSQLESVSLPFPSPLLWVDQNTPGQQVLMRSSDASSVQAGPPFDVSPLLPVDERFAGMTLTPSVLAVVREGSANSAFAKAPEDAGDEAYVAQTQKSRLLVISAPSFLDDNFMTGGNMIAVLNAIDWLSGDEALIALRSRSVTQRPLEALSSAGKSFFKGFWMFGLPLLIAFIGTVRWWQLRRRRAIEE